MSKFTKKLSERGKRGYFYMTFTLTMILIFTLSTGFINPDDSRVEEINPDPGTTCENPLNASLGYNAFIRNATTVKGGDTEGPIAIGGDLTMSGIITIAAHTGGEHAFNGDSEPSSLVVNGKVIYDSGEGIHLNHGYVKVGNMSGSSVHDIDLNSASVNTRVTSGAYDAKPRIQVQRKQEGNTVSKSNVINLEAAFTDFIAKAMAWSSLSANVVVSSDYKIILAPNKVNVINLTAAELLGLPYLTFENAPDVNTPVIINVNTASTFDWNVFNMNNIGDQHGRFILWNFYNAQNITLNGGGTLVGTLFAPKADVTKNSSGNINGQVIAANYNHIGGELHHHPFEPCIEVENPDPCAISVDAGDDVDVCGETEVTLTASVSGVSTCTDCTEVYGIENTYRCGRDFYYVLWLKDDRNNIVRRFSNVDLQWQELADGTATLKGTVVDNNDAQITLEVDVTYTGRTTSTPSGSPKNHDCNTENTDGWVYYTDVSGTVSQTDGSWSFSITRKGPSFQIGNGANVTEDEVGRLGGSGWFDTSDRNFNRGDFNFNLGDCITTQNSEVNYLWSTGETTPSITVTESGTYTVTVKDCKDCEDSDEVTVTFSDLGDVSAGDDQTICLGETITLAASEGDSYEWSTGETTQSIEVTPGETTEYTVIVNKGGCEGSDTVVVTVEELKLNLGDDQFICLGDSVTLIATEGDSYLWSTGETTQTITVTPTEVTNYSVTVTKGACEVSDEVLVTVTDFTAFAGVDETICLDDQPVFSIAKTSITLTASRGGDSYLWSTGETTQSITVSPEVTTTYTVAITKNGCEKTADVTITVEDCDGGPSTFAAAVYPTLLRPDGDLSVDLSLQKSQFITVSIHNLSGRVMGSVITKVMDAGKSDMSIDLGRFSKLSSGVYVIHIKGDEGFSMVKRFVIN